MPRITTQKAFAQSKQLSFCYLCGQPLNNGNPINDDHCPPKSIFNSDDRSNYPIILKVHEQCKHDWHVIDDKLSLLFDPLSGQGKIYKEKHRKKMQKASVCIQNRMIEGFTGLPLRAFAGRIVRCMYAILYKQWLPQGVQGHIMYPFPEQNQKDQLI